MMLINNNNNILLKIRNITNYITFPPQIAHELIERDDEIISVALIKLNGQLKTTAHAGED